MKLAAFLKKSESGLILPTVVLLMIFLSVAGLTLTDFVLANTRAAQRINFASLAQMAADAGGEVAVNGLNTTDPYSGTGGEIDLITVTNRYKVTYEADVTDGAHNGQKIITATGRTYTPDGPGWALKLERKIRVYMQGSSINFDHTVQTGNGPLYMYGNVGLDGDIFTNSFIHMQDNATELGGNIEIAGKDDDSCSLADSGTVANSIINTNDPICGVDTPGSTVNTSAGVLPKPLPSIDYNAVMESIPTDRACSTLNSPSGTPPYLMTSAHYPDIGTGPGDITGGCDVSLQNNRAYRISDSIHVRGDFTATNNTITTLGTDDIYIVVEGEITLDRTVVTGTAPVIFVSYSNVDSNGSQSDPNAIEIAGNNLNMNAYFLAPQGSIGFGGSTSAIGVIGAMAAQSIVMKGSGASVFLSIYPSSLSSRVWSTQEYQRIFD